MTGSFKEARIHILFAVIGLILGAILDRHGGWLYGLLGGLGLGLWIRANAQIKSLEQNIKSLRQELTAASEAAQKRQEQVSPRAEQQAEAVPGDSAPDVSDPGVSGQGDVEAGNSQADDSERAQDAAQAMQAVIAHKQQQQKQTIQAQPLDTSQTQSPAPGDAMIRTERSRAQRAQTPDLPIDRAINWLKNYFTTGNVVVKVGVTVLFFGVAFLVKYAADRDVLPIELRLSAVAILGIGLLITGWRLRERKTTYALVLQGGALAILYLTVFSALRLYELLPASLAFAILFVFAAFSAALAVLQNSRALAVLGISGGFLAPLLTSTGSGSHIALFSYYLVLNLGILGIAWFRSWRMLNVLGFLFTFVIAAAWGYKVYTPQHLQSTEPFLIAFYLLYVAIAVIFSFRQPVQLKGYVDSTLVFGVPLVGFGLQAGMVAHIEYALAWSSLSLAAFYILLASALWKKMSGNSRLLCEAFLALGVMFATLSVPFALDARWTAGTWALEGAAAVWIGARQARLLPRLLGYLLQFAGGFAFLYAVADTGYAQTNEVIILNGDYIGALIVALSSLFVAWRLHLASTQPIANSLPAGSRLKQWLAEEPKLSLVFLLWGLIWWLVSGVNEIDQWIGYPYEPLSLLVFISFSAMAMQYLSTRYTWRAMHVPALGLLPVMLLMLPVIILDNHHPFGDWNFFSWTLAFVVHLWVLKQRDATKTALIAWWHRGGFWLLTLIVTIELSWHIEDWTRAADIWWLVISGLLPALILLSMYNYGHYIKWPVGKHREDYQLKSMPALVVYIGLWFVIMSLLSDGDAYPLAYVPLINPLDMVLLAQWMIVAYWLRFALDIEDWGERRWRYPHSAIILAIALFIWINTVWLRTAHQLWEIPFSMPVLLRSELVHAGLSILWSITGLSCMIFAARKAKRAIWMAGAMVMGAVVIKLFIFDLANTGTVERIVSFISVGGLLLIVGYFAPVPPSSATLNEADSAKGARHEA